MKRFLIFQNGPWCAGGGQVGRRGGLAGAEAVGEVGFHAVYADAFLAHGVPVPDRDRLVVQGVEVDGDTVRGADLVLPAVAAGPAAAARPPGGGPWARGRRCGTAAARPPSPARAWGPGAARSASPYCPWRRGPRPRCRRRAGR